MLLLFFSAVLPLVSAYRQCDASDFRFEYTQCSESGERWRVAVPREDASCRGGVPEPERGLNCSFSCRPGNYLDLETQKCRPCDAGRYSLGNGVRFEEFPRLPAGFSVENFDATADVVLQTSTQSSSAAQCPDEAGWTVRDSELLYAPSRCISKLSFSTSLITPGYVEYVYRMPKNGRGLVLNVVVKNEQCQSYRDELKSVLLARPANRRDEATNGDWQRKRVELRTGPNVISWTVINNRELTSAKEPIRIARIDVVGIAFTRDCPLCPPGTFSRAGAAECQPCEPGTFAGKGSAVCNRCPLSQYSGYKSSRCIDRPKCQPTDYYPVHEPCTNGKTKVTYKKVEPSLCREDVPDAARIPPDEPETACPKCSPGMALDRTGRCVFCQKGEFSDGNACEKCPTSTMPNYGYHYVQWSSLPPNIRTKCEYISEEIQARCDVGEAWITDGVSVVSAPSLQTGIALEMLVDVPEGFANPLLPRHVEPSAANPIAHLTIVFETRCEDDSCMLYFVEDATPHAPTPYYRFLAAYSGSQPRTVWTHAVAKRSPARFLIAFTRSRAAAGEDAVTDQARVFSVNVTNVGVRDGRQGGGASECRPCPDTGTAGQCIPCPAGHYMSLSDHKCVQCPAGTFLNASSQRSGPQSCVKCGPNLQSAGDSCTSTGKFELHSAAANKTLAYDFSALKSKNLIVEGVKVFAREGNSYFHVFNVSLLGGSVECREDFEQSLDSALLYGEGREVAAGSVCRLTVLPVSGKNASKTTAHVSPMLLGIELAAITTAREFDGWRLSDEILDLAYMVNASDATPDVHFFFSSPQQPTDACPNGSAIALTARCDPQQKKAELHLPRACPDGTCDGCLYHAFLEAAVACPLCTPSDYTVINGECVDGWQTVHTIPDKQCVLSGAASQERKQHCSVLSAHLKLAIAIGTFAILGLVLVLAWILKKNKRLEYKYMKLIESKNGGFELPEAETCGLHSDEEDDEGQERVIFSKGRRSFFSKAAKPSTSSGNGSSSAFVPLREEED